MVHLIDLAHGVARIDYGYPPVIAAHRNLNAELLGIGQAFSRLVDTYDWQDLEQEPVVREIAFLQYHYSSGAFQLVGSEWAKLMNGIADIPKRKIPANEVKERFLEEFLGL